MKKYTKVDINGYIVSTTDLSFPQKDLIIFDFPEEFDFSIQGKYKIIDGRLKFAGEELEIKAEAEEKRRPLTESEVSRMLISAQINTLTVDDEMALRMKEFYPNWESGISYEKDFKVQYNGRLYKVLQAHTSQADWTPDIVPSLYTEINETADGTLDNPIPYNGNMALEKGRYYSQNGVIYLCTRDTINPVYNDLKDLVGLYVEVA